MSIQTNIPTFLRTHMKATRKIVDQTLGVTGVTSFLLTTVQIIIQIFEIC